ncbi:MAG: rhamnose ABC transporter substrate-binding protein [Pseudolysinimonas sp.]
MELIRNGGRAKRALTITAAAAAVALVLGGCAAAGGDGGGDAGGSEGASITFIPKNLNNPYTNVELRGGEEASEELGLTYNSVGSLEAAADSQIPFIQTEVQNGTQIVALAANDPNAPCAALKEAKDGGAAIITFDSDTDVSCRDLFITQVEEKEVALGQLRQLFDQIGGEGDIAILSAAATASNQNAWIAAMEQEIADNPDYEWNLVATVYGDDDDNKSFQEAQGLLQSYPNLKGIISPTTVGIAATARYLSTSEYKGKVALVGLGLPPQMKEYIKDGTVTAFALWDPSDIGYLTAYAGKALLDGTITGAEGDTFDAGKLGSYTVGKDGRVVVGSLLEFNADNIDDYDYITF